MKRIILTSLFCSALFFSFGQSSDEKIINVKEEDGSNTLLIEFRLPAFNIADTNFGEMYGIDELFNYIQIDDEFGVIDSVGLPQLPQLTFDLHVPRNAVEFKIEIVSTIKSVMNVQRRIMPAQEDINNEEPVFVFRINNEYYNSQGGFCNLPVQLSENFIVFGEQGISLTVFPFVYNPMGKSLTVLSNVVFRVSYRIKEGVTEGYYSETKENYLNSLFQNYHKSGGNPIMGRYLMITPPEYESTLTYFANYKRNIGFEVDVFNTNTTGSSVASIKNFIQNRYNNVNTRPDYVLLVGDVDKIPAYEGDESDKPDINNPITDLGYSLLEGNDNLADVFLGRFSVSNPFGNEELINIINKTIFMEMNMHRFEKKAKFLAGDHAGTGKIAMRNAFKDGHEYVIPYSFNSLGYNCQKLYQPTRTDAINALSDNPLFYIYSGHGNISCLSLLNGSESFRIRDNHISEATNTVFPCMFSFACKTGHFADTSGYISICESFIRAKDKGAVAYFGCSVNSLNNPDGVLEKKIFGDAFLKDEQNLAVIINLGKRRFTYTSAIYKNRYLKAYNLLGDPSFDTKGIGCKQSFTFYYPEVFKSGSEITYRANDFIENNNTFIVESGASVKLLAGNRITLKPGFKAEAGSNVSIQIVPCDNGLIQKSLTENNNEDTVNSTEIEQKSDEIINPAMFSIFPNPTNDDFSLAYTLEDSSFVQIDLYNMSGAYIKTFLQLPKQDAGVYYYNFSLSGLSSGIYVLIFKNTSRTISNKIIKH